LLVTLIIDILNQEAQDVCSRSEEHWNEDIAEAFKEFVVSGGTNYSNIPHNKRKAFRKRAKDFCVKDGKLYYQKTPGLLRLAIGSKEEQRMVFQVNALASFVSLCQIDGVYHDLGMSL
jgi:histidinol-phosphate/aromatic aminotransferase/cobyric acid decarboxylase-like protein